MKQRGFNQSGNALFLILIAIFLLGGLAALMARSNSDSEDTGSTEQATIKASQLIRYAASIKSAVDAARSRGCSENQINFRWSLTSGINPNAPADGSCSVFTYAKGPLQFVDWRAIGIQTQSGTGCYFCNQSYFNGDAMWHPSTPTVAPELSFFLAGIDKNLCLAINRVVGVTNTGGNPPDATSNILGGNDFNGTFATSTNSDRDIVSAGGELVGKMTGCMNMMQDGVTAYTFYSVLIPR